MYNKNVLILTTLVSALFHFYSVSAQLNSGCEDLLISEYCEGSGNNKGIEIYNPTPGSIDLGPYVIQRWSNGAMAVSDEADLIGTIEPYGTWVLVNGQTEDIDLGGGAVSPAADPEMQAYADQLDSPYPAPMFFNGNDALLLIKNGNAIVDIFGKPGEDPGIAWTDDEATGYTSADGGTWLTVNKTLRRKPEVTQGVTIPPVEFYALAEWDSLPNNTWEGLGFHECACLETPSAECNSDYDFGDAGFGISPDPELDETFETGCLNEFYSDTIHLLIPSDAGEIDDQFSGIPIDSMTLGTVELIDGGGNLLPLQNIGLSVTCNNNEVSPEPCTFVGGSQYCALIQGTPQECGDYQLVMTFEAHLSFLGQTLTQEIQFDQYIFNVDCDCGCEILGCTDETACNFNPDADCDDGTCDFGIAGCTDPSACNYNEIYTCENGTCCYDNLNEYNPTLIPDDQMQSVVFEIEVSGAEPLVVSSESDIGYVYANLEHSYLGDLVIELICPSGNSMILHQQGGGGTYLGEPIDNNLLPDDYGVGYDYFWTPSTMNGTMEEESAGVNTLPEGEYSSVQSFNNLIGCPSNGTWELVFTDLFSIDNGFVFDAAIAFGNEVPVLSCEQCSVGCTDPMACNYWEYALEDDGSCIFPDGCTDPSACNYDSGAQCNDGSCDYVIDECGECGGTGTSGCTDQTACNYDDTADCDDGSCEYAVEFFDCEGNCLNDADNDGICDELEIAGCTDPEACNYDEAATDDDGSCISEPSLSISGTTVVTQGSSYSYSVSGFTPSDFDEVEYTWSLSNVSLGTIDAPTSSSPIITFTSDILGAGALCVEITLINDDASCTTETCIDFELVVNINEQSLEQVKLYPNPTADYLTLELPEQLGSVECSFVDALGRTVLEESLSGNSVIDLTTLSTGVYTLHVYAGKQHRSFRIMKQ